MSQIDSLAADLPKKGGPEIEWSQIEQDYRAGLKSLRAIAAEHDISETAIRKRARRDDWTRDLTQRIAAKAADKVRNAEVRKQVRADAVRTERKSVEVAAEIQANIMLAHRKDVPRVRGLLTKLLAELEGATDARDDLEHIGEILNGGDEARMVELFRKLNSLPGRIDSGKKLADALKTAVSLERDVFGIGGITPNDDDQVIVIRREIVGVA